MSVDEFELYKSGMSIPEVYDITGIPKSTLRFRFSRAGILRSRGDGVRLSESRGRNPHRGNRHPKSEETKEKLRQAALIRGEKFAKGVSLKPNGYLEVTRGEDKGRGGHVVIMEEFIGRKVEKWEVVHHKDFDRSNNDLLNLELMDKKDHLALHRKLNPMPRGGDGRFKKKEVMGC